MVQISKKPVQYKVLIDNFYEIPCQSYYESYYKFYKLIKSNELVSICYTYIDQNGDSRNETIIRYKKDQGFKIFTDAESMTAIFHHHHPNLKIKGFEIGSGYMDMALHGFWVKIIFEDDDWGRAYFDEDARLIFS